MNPYYPVSIVHRVADLEGAVELLEQALDFAVQQRDAGWVLLDNGAIAIRLEPRSPSEPEATLRIELATRDVQEAAARLFEVGAQVSGPLSWVSTQRQEQLFHAPYGLELLLTRFHNEDEAGIVPDLPTSLEWETDATARVKELLRRVPVDFREQARRRSTERAEALALERGEVLVDLELAIRGVVQMTPAIRVEEVRLAIVELGLDPSRWEEDFER